MSDRAPSSPRIAIIGAGYWGKNIIRNFNDLKSLTAVCDLSSENLTFIREHYPSVSCTSDFNELLENPDINAIAIATNPETHNRLARAALMAGKDVFVEKPLSLSVDAGQELVDIANRENRILMVGHLLWYHPAVIKLKEIVDNGELGRIQYIYSNRLNIGKIRREENILWSFAPHDISVILGLIEDTPISVQSQGGNYLHEKIADVTVSLLTFNSGVKAHIFVSWLHPIKEQKLVVVGDKQMAVFDDTVPTEDKLKLYPHSIDWKNQLPVVNKSEAVTVALDWVEPLASECAHFLNCIQTRRTPRTDGEEALRVLAVLHQCQLSLANENPPKIHSRKTKNRRENNDAEYFVHSSAFIDDHVTIGSGTKIWHVTHILHESTIGKNCNIGQNVVIGPKVDIGNGVKIQNNVCVYEGVTLEDHVFCGPSMVFTNVMNPRSEVKRMDELRPTLVKRGASLGANCTIVCGISIGRYAFVGAGAVVTRDVPDYALVVGSPATVKGWMCECGEKLHFDTAGQSNCNRCGLYVRQNDQVFKA